jgi:hypothetical protein
MMELLRLHFDRRPPGEELHHGDREDCHVAGAVLDSDRKAWTG